jgi:hypothetical protein
MATCLNPGSDTWMSPVNLTPDERIHSNVAASFGPMGIHSINLDGGRASLKERLIMGGGGIVADEKRYVVMNTPIHPDPAIVGLRPDFPFASPGSVVKVAVEVENKGLRSTPLLRAGGTSALGVGLTILDGTGRVLFPAVTGIVPEVPPGERRRVVLEVEMPLEPARLRAELVPGPFDADLKNNVKEIALGAPPPADLSCSVVPYTKYDLEGNAVETLAVRIDWKNPATYDQVLIYRDGSMLAGPSGKTHLWIDTMTNSGTHTYEVRGRISVSKSARGAAACTITVVPPYRAGFKRGDINNDGAQDLSDAIMLLGFLYLGQPATLICEAAGRLNEGNDVDLSDAIYLLGFLYLGTAAPPYAGYPGCEEFPDCPMGKFCP